MVIPAAGLGSRLRPYTDDRPKSLVPVAGVPLLWHLLGTLHALGVEEAIVICGYRGARLRRELADCPRSPRLVFVDNPDFERNGSLLSLAASRPYWTDGFTHIDGDLLVRPELLRQMVHATANVIAVDRTREHAAIDWKTEVRHDRIVTVSRDLPPARTSGEILGFSHWTPEGARALADAVDDMVTAGQAQTEHHVFAMLHAARKVPVTPLYTGGGQWFELDNACDLPAAEAFVTAG
ncbi:NTP transferase domain-containing protein [Streptomyces sp. URMC 123]|uniref:phosphocholine cytidylyltransferase family protein n=1 Tax=Streptomyces sp. URMC 123 TaxID=3423403 RepID=UPI003F1AB041